jgi:exodeoxyribonuclease-3
VKIASWNVNSIKARLPRVLEWLEQAAPDVALLQEIKTETDAFPFLEIEELGYNLAVSGQKTYNGVAILSKFPLEDVARRLPGDEDDTQARYVEALSAGPAPVRLASIYLPNGNPVDSEKFAYKLDWMERLRAHAAGLLKLEEAFVLGGDYNVAPTDDDVYDPDAWRDDALCRPESRARFRAILNLGLTEGGAWAKDLGLRIDHLLLSPQAADRLTASGIDKGPRAKPKASDHTPVWCELEG